MGFEIIGYVAFLLLLFLDWLLGPPSFFLLGLRGLINLIHLPIDIWQGYAEAEREKGAEQRTS